MKKWNQISRVLRASVIIGLALMNVGCSFQIRFNIINQTENSITVNYTLKDSGDGFSPRLVLENSAEGGTKYIPIPEDRIRVDKENRVVEFKLLPHENVEIYSTIDRRDNDYEKEFNLASLRIIGADGSKSLEGREVFKSFRPIKNGLFEFGPDVIGFVLEYR